MNSSQPVSEKKTAAPEAADTIKVVIRFKGREELSDSELSKWQFDEDYKSVQAPCPPGDKRTNMDTLKYTFDDILVEATQEKMYYYAGQETVKLFTSGFNGTIFAYGMSGTGKTYSMLGPETVVEVIKQGGEISEDIQSQYGIIPRAIRDIFEFMNYAIEKEGASFELMMNYFEIYKESLNDLLQPNKEAANNLKMMGSKVVNSYKVMIDSPETIFDHIKKGQNRVHTEATGMNDRSSRSHSILVLEYNQINKDGSKKNAKLNLVDLAGSERIAKTGASGKVLEEAKKINLSLTVLGRVIQALGEGGNVPFRESTLTKLLKESLGGNSKTALICTTSRKDCHLEETIQSLQFAKRVKKVKNKAVVSVQLTSEQMQALIVKLKQEVYVLRQKLIVTNGSSFDKNLTSSDAEKLKDKNSSEAKKRDPKADSKAATKKVDAAPAAGAKPAAKATKAKDTTTKDTKAKATKTQGTDEKKAPGASPVKESREKASKLSIDTKREQVKAMLEQSVATPKVELEVVEEEMVGGEAQPDQQVSSPQMLQTPRKDLDRNMSPDKVSDQASTTQMSPFKTPCKADDKSATKEGRHSFLQSFNSEGGMSLRKSLIENPYSSFISLQSEYFDTNTKVCTIQNPVQDVQQQKINQEQFETLQELIQRQQVQLDSRNDLLIQRDTEIDRLYMENSQLTKNVEQLKEKIDNQAMDVYFKVAEEMNKQFKMYYSAQDSFQQMDELFDDLKRQSEKDTAENKALFTSISDIEAEMHKYESWIRETKLDWNEAGDKSLKPKNAEIEIKPDVVVANAQTQLASENIVQKENMESLQKIVASNQQADTEKVSTDFYDNKALRSALVNTTLTNLHVLHQYKALLNLVKDNFMTRPRVNKKAESNSPRKPIQTKEVQEVTVVETNKTEGVEPNSGINPEIVSPNSVEMGQGSFKTEESKPTCDTEKEPFVQVVPETQELITLRNQVKIQQEFYNDKVQEIKKQNELIERLKRQHENLREQINRVDKENIKLKKKMDQDNLNKQQQYLSAIQDPNQQYQYQNAGNNKAEGITGWVQNMWNGAVGTKVIQKKVDVNSGGFFSKKVFANNMYQNQQNQQNGYSPAIRGPYDRNNTNKRPMSPSKRGNTSVNAYEYNQGKKLLGNTTAVDNRQSQSTDFDFRKKDFKPKNYQSSAKPATEQVVQNDVTNTVNTGSVEVQNRISQGSSSSNKMQKISLSLNKGNEESGVASFKSNSSFRIADNLFEIDQNQLNQNSFTNGQFKYQAKPPSPKKTDRFEKNGPAMQQVSDTQSQDGSKQKQVPRVRKFTRQEIENRPGKYDADNFYILPGGDFFDPHGYYFDKKGYDQLGGHYDTVTGNYIPGTEYAHLSMQKNQSYHAGDNRSSNKKMKFGGFDNGIQEDNTQLRRNYGSFHAHQNNQSFHGQQYSNFFPQKGGWNQNKNNGFGYHSNTQQDFYRRNTTNGVEVVHTPAKDKKMNFGDNYDQMSASSKNSFQRDSNYKSNKKPFKPTQFDKTNTDDKPVENAPASNGKQENKGNDGEQEEMLLVTKL